MKSTWRRGTCALALLGLAVATQPASAAGYLRPAVNEHVTVGFDGSQSTNPVEFALGTSWNSAMSADGRIIAFSSTATNLVPGDINQVSDVFVRDRITRRTEIVSVASNGDRGAICTAGSTNGSSSPSISANGRYVAFTSCSPNLVPNDLNLARDGFVHDRVTRKTEIVSVSSTGKQGTMPLVLHDSSAAAISPDGRYVVVNSYADDLMPNDTNGSSDAFVFDRTRRTLERVSVNSAEQQSSSATALPNGGGIRPNSFGAAISDGGRFVSFNSAADNLVPGDTNLAQDLFVRDRVKGTTERVSVRTGGAQNSGGPSQGAGATLDGGRGISADGRYVLMNSSGSGFIPNDTGEFDTFVHDRATGRMQRISVRSTGGEANGSNNSGSISLDGRYVMFSSQASNLAEGDTGSNGSNTTTIGEQPGDYDVFIYDRKFGTVEMISRSTSGQEAKGTCKAVNAVLSEGASESQGGSMSTDGRYTVFQSCANNLAGADTNGTRDHFLRDRGPHLGVRGVRARVSGSAVTVSGWATFSGAVLTSAADPTADGGAGSAVSGAEIVGGELLYRPELDDLHWRLDLTQIPSAGVSLGGLSAPGDVRVLYAMRFSANGQTYEVRVHRIGVNTANPLDAGYGLFACTEITCNQVAELKGGYGTTGEQIVVSIPMAVITKSGKPVGEGATLSALRSFTSFGSYLGGPTQLLDQLVMTKAASVAIPAKSVTVTVNGRSVRAALTKGGFTTAIPLSAFRAGTSTVIVTTCLGKACQSERIPVRV